MSELKFNCPVCGQHIASDSSASGAQIECPTCFQSIIVPQAPKAQSKYILSATQYIKPQPAPRLPPGSIPRPAGRRPFVSESLLALFVACIVGVAIYVLYARAHRSGSAPAPTTAADVRSPRREWRLDLADIPFPDEIAAGRIHGMDFANEGAYLQNNVLALRQGLVHQPELVVNVYLPVREIQELAGRNFDVRTNTPGAVPYVVLRWKSGGAQETETFTNGYALKLKFGLMGADRVSGRLYLCLPDAARSFVAGTFSAEIKR